MLSRCPQGRIPSGAAAARRLHGHLWSWKHDLLLLEKKLPAGGRAAERSGASHRDGADRSHFPTTHTSPFLQSLSWPLFTSRLSFLAISLPIHLEARRRAVPIPTSVWRQQDIPPAALEPHVLSHHGSIAHPSLPNLSAGRSLHFSHQHAQRRRQLPSAIIRPHLTPPSTASCWCN